MLIATVAKGDAVTAIEPPAGYAGFWKRTQALVIDNILINATLFVAALPIEYMLSRRGASVSDIADAAAVACVLVYWLYYAAMESSKLRATIGKRFCGIKVTDLRGNRVGFGLASIRWVGRIISFLTAGIGFFMAAFTRRQQALHDILAGCLVVNADSRPAGLALR